ncbi:MAG: hypothetical protein RR908_02310 [Rikenellaceae bacterium]
MLKNLIVLALINLISACSINEDSSSVSNRTVTYSATTIMPNVELVADYYEGGDVTKHIIISEFPWEVETQISPFRNIGISGYMRYKDDKLPIIDYIDLKIKIDAGSEYLDKEKEISIESFASGVTNADLYTNTKFSLMATSNTSDED